jgi:hypothetical protein
MGSMRNILLAALAGALVALGVGVLAGAGASGTDDTTTTTETVTETVEAPGPEDRHEDRGVREAGEDISGPCDDAEHANDPRCTGVAAPPASRVDNSGPGSMNSGPSPVNSGSGSGDD